MGQSPARIWCPTCEELQPCRSIKTSTFGEHEDGNQWTTASGIHFFRRLRQCEGCGEDFPTVEITEADFNDLEGASTTLKAVKAAIRKRR